MSIRKLQRTVREEAKHQLGNRVTCIRTRYSEYTDMICLAARTPDGSVWNVFGYLDDCVRNPQAWTIKACAAFPAP